MLDTQWNESLQFVYTRTEYEPMSQQTILLSESANISSDRRAEEKHRAVTWLFIFLINSYLDNEWDWCQWLVNSIKLAMHETVSYLFCRIHMTKRCPFSSTVAILSPDASNAICEKIMCGYLPEWRLLRSTLTFLFCRSMWTWLLLIADKMRPE